MRLHRSITRARLIDAVLRRGNGLDNPGFCILCGAEAEGCEPDVCEYMCEVCDEPTVYGAEEILFEVQA